MCTHSMVRYDTILIIVLNQTNHNNLSTLGTLCHSVAKYYGINKCMINWPTFHSCYMCIKETAFRWDWWYENNTQLLMTHSRHRLTHYRCASKNILVAKSINIKMWNSQSRLGKKRRSGNVRNPSSQKTIRAFHHSCPTERVLVPGLPQWDTTR